MRWAWIIGVAVGGWWLAGGASAATLVQYTFPSSQNATAFVPTEQAPGVSGGALGVVAGQAELLKGSTPPETMYFRPMQPATDEAAAVQEQQYFEFVLWTEPAWKMSLSRLWLEAARGSASPPEPRVWFLRSSLDDFSATLAIHEVTTVRPALLPYAADLSGLAFQDLVGSVTFRVYEYAPGAFQGLQIDNLTIEGTAVPLPPAVWGGLALLGAVAAHARRRARAGE